MKRISNIIYSFCETTDRAVAWASGEKYSPEEEYSLAMLAFFIMLWLLPPVVLIVRVITLLSKVKFRKIS